MNRNVSLSSFEMERVFLSDIITKLMFRAHATVVVVFFFFVVCLFVLKFYNSIVPFGISTIVKSGRFPRGKPATTESRYPLTVHGEYFCVSIIHRTLTWTTGSLTCAHMLTHAIAPGVCGHRERVRIERLLWEKRRKKNLPYRRIEPALAACRSAALPI